MDNAGTEMDIVRRKALYAEFQQQVVDLPILAVPISLFHDPASPT